MTNLRLPPFTGRPMSGLVTRIWTACRTDVDAASFTVQRRCRRVRRRLIGNSKAIPAHTPVDAVTLIAVHGMSEHEFKSGLLPERYSS